MVDVKFSIILQGVVDPHNLQSISNARKYSDDVIVSTWEGAFSDDTAGRIEAMGARLIVSADPGTIKKYQRGSVEKGLNFHRQILGTLSGAKAAKHHDVIRTRSDVCADYATIHKLLTKSEKPIGCANVTSICPNRLFVQPRWFHGSDWLISCQREHILKQFPLVLSAATETELMAYFPDLATEQFWTLANILEEFSIPNIQKSSEEPFITHKLYKALILNMPADSISLTSSKYRNRAIRWATYNTPDYSDENLIGPITTLPYYLAALLFR